MQYLGGFRDQLAFIFLRLKGVASKVALSARGASI
jgi:hypothetical protein